MPVESHVAKEKEVAWQLFSFAENFAEL